MAESWKRTNINGLPDYVPSGLTDKYRQKPGGNNAGIGLTSVPDTLENHKHKPGNFSWNYLINLYFNRANIVKNGDFSDATEDDTDDGNFAGWINGGTHSATNHFTISEIDGSNRLSIIRGGGTGLFYIYQTILCGAGNYTYSVDINQIGPGFQFLDYDFDVGGHVMAQFTPSDGTGTKTGSFKVLRDSTQFLIVSRQSNVDTTTDSGFGDTHTYVAGTSIIDNISILPDLAHVPDGDADDDGSVDSDEGASAGIGTFDDTVVSTWFRDDGSTTT